MAKDDKKEIPMVQGTTPRGVFKYPHLTSLDHGTQDYPKENGEYNVRLILSEDAAEKLRDQLDELYQLADEAGKAAYKELKPAQRKKIAYKLNPLGDDVLDDETEEPTGEVEFRFKTVGEGTYKKGKREGEKWEKVLPIYDSKGNLIKDCPPIWGGSEGKIAFTAKPYFVAAQGMAGLALYIDEVQLLKLVSGSGAPAEKSSKFGAEEDGYVAEDKPANRFDEDEDEEGADSEEGSDGEEDF